MVPEYNFIVDDASTNYRLNVGGYSGTAGTIYTYVHIHSVVVGYILRLNVQSHILYLTGDSLAFHNSMPFSTYDRDNDRHTDDNCAEKYKGGWWYNSCYHSNLNGLYLPGQNNVSSANWGHFTDMSASLKYIAMKMELQ